MTINFGFGTVGTTTTGVSGLGASSYPLARVSYGQLRTALVAHASTIAALSGVAAALPPLDPTGGGAFYITSTEAGALGLTGTNIGVVGNIGIGSSDLLGFTALGTNVVGGGYWAVGSFEHEISEVPGRAQSLGAALGAGNYDPFDLFRGCIYFHQYKHRYFSTSPVVPRTRRWNLQPRGAYSAVNLRRNSPHRAAAQTSRSARSLPAIFSSAR